MVVRKVSTTVTGGSVTGIVTSVVTTSVYRSVAVNVTGSTVVMYDIKVVPGSGCSSVCCKEKVLLEALGRLRVTVMEVTVVIQLVISVRKVETLSCVVRKVEMVSCVSVTGIVFSVVFSVVRSTVVGTS